MPRNQPPGSRTSHRGSPHIHKAWLCAASALAIFSGASSTQAAPIHVVDIIPNATSAEVGQNSEPSLAVNPIDPTQMIAGAFSSTFSCAFNCGTNNELDTVASPYWKSTDGGTTWTSFGSLQSVDKSLAWQQNGAAAVTTPLSWADASGNTQIQTFSGTIAGANFGAAINTSGRGDLDQPWIRTGPSGQTYVALNNLGNPSGKTASLLVSSNNGATYGPQVTLETVAPAGGQDAPSVRTAVNGSTVYAAFTRWGSAIEDDANGIRFGNSQVVVVKSTDSGTSFSSGVTAATTTGYFANLSNTPLTLGQERTGSDVAIAVDPNNPNRVIVAYGDAPGANGSGLLQLHIVESTDGGATWSNKFTTSASVRSGLPALSILANGAVGLLYESYDPNGDQLSQFLLTTGDDFATTSETLLGTQSNTTPIADFFPYVGDFFDLTSVDDTFYGIFSGSNADNGTLASYPDVSFLRDFSGTPGSASFDLTDLNGAPVAFSIDPFVFSTTVRAVPEPATLTLLGVGLAALGALQRRQRRSRVAFA